jgi:type VI secretion system protein ImpA
MKRTIDIDAILAPISDDKPAGVDLRYSSTYDEIKEARKSDDLLDRGDWQREVKRADWDSVLRLAVDALTNKTKDLQIAAWLTEALINTEGFGGLGAGLGIINGLLDKFWETVYPEIEEGDLDFRAAPLEFMNEKLWPSIRQIPLTDSASTPGYAWVHWQDSRVVGYEADTRNRYGDVDENKKRARDERISEGKMTAEEFDSGVSLSSRSWFEPIAADLALCLEEFKKLDAAVDEKFGSNAPRLAELFSAIEDCERLVAKILKDKRGSDPVPEPTPVRETEPQPKSSYIARLFKRQREPDQEPEAKGDSRKVLEEEVSEVETGGYNSDARTQEMIHWEEALKILESSGMREAIERLLVASCSAPSVRDKNRYRLLMAKLCLKAERPDLARPIVEELHSLIEELHLERWESPLWIAEVLDAFYRCLIKGEGSDEDISKAEALFQRLCTTDVTKAMVYKY